MALSKPFGEVVLAAAVDTVSATSNRNCAFDIQLKRLPACLHASVVPGHSSLPVLQSITWMLFHPRVKAKSRGGLASGVSPEKHRLLLALQEKIRWTSLATGCFHRVLSVGVVWAKSPASRLGMLGIQHSRAARAAGSAAAVAKGMKK